MTTDFLTKYFRRNFIRRYINDKKITESPHEIFSLDIKGLKRYIITRPGFSLFPSKDKGSYIEPSIISRMYRYMGLTPQYAM